jgi:hypothetical protein
MLGVRYVVLPHVLLATVDGQQEARLLSSGRSGLQLVHSDSRFTVYQLPGATLLTGPGRPQLTAVTHRGIDGRVDRPGSYLLRVHFSPYLKVS